MGAPLDDAADGDPLDVARRIALIVLAVEIALLAVSGVWLVFNYRPDPSGLHAVGARIGSVRGRWIRTAHRNIGQVAVLTSLAAGGLIMADAIVHGAGRRRMALLVVGPLLILAVLAASFSGYLLPWDQLALFAVTTGNNIKGYFTVFGPVTRFVLVRNVELSRSTIWRWFIIHTVVMTVAIVGLATTAVRLRSRRSARAAATKD
jgi:quinol-cytochrome oxidoreductase complex cytochrome b subunit